MKLPTRKSIKINDYSDSGFSAKVEGEGARFINRDGSFNAQKKGIPFFERFSFYHALITIEWWKFHLLVLVAFISINLLFGWIYLIIGVENLEGMRGATNLDKYFEAVFFSTQTLTTIGYGRVNPIGFLGNLVASAESLMGLMFLALATGVLYGRFSRPVGKIIFSAVAVVAPFKTNLGLMFRLANARNNQITNSDILVFLALRIMENGVSVRKFYELKLERTKINYLPLNWTVVHPIDENSPLFGFSKQDFDASDAEIMVSLNGFDDTYMQNIHSRTSYKHYEVEWNVKFQPMSAPSPDGMTTILDMRKISAIEKYTA